MKTLAGLATLAALGLAACGTTTGSTAVGNINTFSSNVQAISRALCAFEPTLATVAAIAATLVPGASPVEVLASKVADGICAAVKNGSAVTVAEADHGYSLLAWLNPITPAYAGPKPSVNGVVVHGRYTGK